MKKNILILLILFVVCSEPNFAQFEINKEHSKDNDCNELHGSFNHLPNNIYDFLSKIEIGINQNKSDIDSLFYYFFIEHNGFSLNCLNLQYIIFKTKNLKKNDFQYSEAYSLFSSSIDQYITQDQNTFLKILDSLEDMEVYNIFYFLFADDFCLPIYDYKTKKLINVKKMNLKRYSFIKSKKNKNSFKILQKVLSDLDLEMKY
jgi:hypothetical protein